MPEGDNPVGSLGHCKIWALHDLEREALVLEHGARAACKKGKWMEAKGSL